MVNLWSLLIQPNEIFDTIKWNGTRSKEKTKQGIVSLVKIKSQWHLESSTTWQITTDETWTSSFTQISNSDILLEIKVSNSSKVSRQSEVSIMITRVMMVKPLLANCPLEKPDVSKEAIRPIRNEARSGQWSLAKSHRELGYGQNASSLGHRFN